MCKCGCGTCETKIRGPLLTEGKVKVKSLLSENLQYHLDKDIPLFESVFRIGSDAHLNLIKEARKMYSRDIIDLCEEDEHIIKTHLGEFGVYEGEAVPLDLPMLNVENIQQEKLLSQIRDILISIRDDGEAREEDIEDLDISIDSLTSAITGKTPIGLDIDQNIFGRFADPTGKGKIKEILKQALTEAKKKKKKEKKDPPLGKPKRGGPKAYYVYVRDPKTKKIKKVTFGSGGLRAKIKNKKARNAFAKRHNCKNKKDRTKASYWSCNLPRYASMLGLGANMNTFW